MLNLEPVTLLLHNGLGDPKGAVLLRRMAREIRFGQIFHVSPVRPEPSPGYWLPVPRVDGYAAGNCLALKTLFEIGDQPWVLNIELDGFPVHPELWRDEFFEYDYIGAPWAMSCEWHHGFRVGNGGCSLRSRRFIAAMRGVDPGPDPPAADVFCCCTPEVRREVNAAGCRYAPVELAIQFSLELPVEDFPEWTHAQSFGFHRTLPGLEEWYASG